MTEPGMHKIARHLFCIIVVACVIGTQVVRLHLPPIIVLTIACTFGALVGIFFGYLDDKGKF